MAHIIPIPTSSDTRGDLSVLEEVVPFKIKRVYYIYNVPNKEIIRGGHRHKKTQQLLVCIKGKCTIYNHNGNFEEEFHLNLPSSGLLLEPEDWHSMKSFSEGTVLLVLASEKYDSNDYISDKYE